MAGSNNTLSLLIETKSTGSAEISKLELALNRLADASEKAGKRTADAGQKSADTAKGIANQLRSIGESPLTAGTSAVEKYALSLGKVGGVAVGASAGVAALALGIYEITKQTAQAALSITNFSTRLGLSVGEGQRLSAMAKITGVDISVLESSTRLVAAALEDSSGKGAKAAKALAELGVSTRTIKGDQRELGVVTSEVIEKLAGVESITKRTALANAILGRGSKELQPLLANYKELNDTVKQLGIGLDENGTRQLTALAKQINIADLAFEQFKKNLTAKIAPVVIPIIASVSEVLNQNSQSKSAQAARGIVIGGLVGGIFPGLGGIIGADAAKSVVGGNVGPPAPPAPPAVADPDLARGRELSDVYRKQLSNDETFIKARIEEIKSGSIGPGGVKINGTDYDRQNLTSNDVGASEKVAAKKRIDDGEKEIANLETQLKVIESRKSIEIELLKIAKEAEAAEDIAYPGSLLPSQRKYQELKAKPGVSPDQLARAAAELQPEFVQESNELVKKAIASNHEYLDNVADAAGVSKTAKTPEEQSQQLREQNEKRDALRKYQTEQEQKRLEESIPILTNIQSLTAGTALSKVESGINIQGILGGPGTELNTAARLASAKKASLQEQYTFQLQLDEKEYAYSDALEDKKQETRLKYAQEVAQLEIQLSEQVAQEQKKQREQGRELAGGIFDAAVSHQVPKFFQSYGQSIGKTIFQNGTQDIFAAAKIQIPGQGTITNPTALGKLFQGTPFGLDPLKGAGDPLKGATDLNTAATTSNTGILQRLTELVESKLSFSTSGAANSTGDLSNAFSFAGGAGTGLGPQLFGDTSSGFSFLGNNGAAASDPFSFLGGGAASSSPDQALSLLSGGQPSALANLARLGASGASNTQLAAAGLGLLKPGGALGSFFGGLSFGGTPGTPGSVDYSTGTFVPGTDPTPGVSGAQLLGTGVQVGGGVLGLINGLNTGGAKGGLQAAGGAAAAAGGILSTLSSTLAIAGPIGAAVGAVLGIVSSFVGDPKQNRQKAISKTAENYQFYQPEAINLSEGTNGGFSDYDKSGNVRSSNISPYPSVSEPYYLFQQHVLVPGQTNSQFGGQSGNQTVNNNYNISAMDSQSFADYTAANHQAIADAFLTNMDRGNTQVVDRLRTNL